MDHELEPIAELGRVSTGIPGLDTLLRGGLIEGGVYLLLGQPGTGKTILSNHVAFSHVRAGGRVVYTTVLSETHARMLSNLRPFEFFDQSVVGDAVFYVSGYQALEREGLAGLLRLLRQMVRERRASLLVVDGIVTALAFPTPEIELKRFVHELKTFAETVGCTVLILSSLPSLGTHYPAQTMVDGIVTVTRAQFGMRSVREIEVSKSRGSEAIAGTHTFGIVPAGIAVYPRLESLSDHEPAAPTVSTELVPVGVPALDALLDGGVPRGSVVAVAGAAGTGKTLIGLQFLLEGARRGERGLFLGFQESPERLLASAKLVGLELETAVREGLVELVWRPASELLGDAIAGELCARVDAAGVRRVAIDSVDDLTAGLGYPDRALAMIGALANHLRSRGVTTIATHEVSDVIGGHRRIPEHPLTRIAEGIVLLRYVEQRGTLERRLMVLKMRGAAHHAGERSLHDEPARRAKRPAKRAPPTASKKKPPAKRGRR